MKKIIDCLETYGCIHEEDVWYASLKGSDPYPFTCEEFNEYTQKIWNENGGWENSLKYFDPKVYFETYVVPFFFDGKEYRMVVMCGQGISWSLCSIDECNKWMERNRKNNGK